nr:fimbrillin family protein [Bacteroides intestinalis]
MKRVLEKIALWIVFITLLMACNSDFEDESGKVFASLQVTLSNFEGNTDTRTQESGYQTTFIGNEQIGIFSLKASNNTVLDNNVPYKYNASTNSWQPVNTGNQIYVYGSGVTYYAYYPYNSNMNDKKSIAEITTAFTLPEDQSTYDNYSSADLMTTTGTLSSSTLSLPFTHAMSLIEIEIDETSNSSASYDPAPIFYGIKPWKMSDGIYRYLVEPGIDAEIGFDYGPADNRYAFQKSLAAADITAGKYIRIKAPFDNRYLELNTGNYVGVLGPVSKVEINGTEYSTSLISGSNNRYLLDGLRKSPETFTSFNIYITDNLATADSKEQLLLAVTTSNITIDATNKSLVVPLSAGGMEGAGTLSDPYLVTTPPQLRGFAQNTAGYYKQMANIDLLPYTNWNPSDISGVYDGNHKEIQNLNFSGGGGGLFKDNRGTIKNTHILSGTLKGTGLIGGICSKLMGSSNAVVENCSNAATIEGTNDNGSGTYIGGISGNIEGSCIVRYCRNSGTITGKAELIGGITGWASSGTVSYCYNVGAVTPTKPYHPGKSAGYGGISGGTYYGNATLSYCYNIGTILANSWSGDGAGTAKRGEIVGWTDSGNGVQHNWYKDGDTPVGDNGSNASDNNKFDNSSNTWPTYSAETSNGWGSSHWKSYNQGEYPKLLWEP